MNTGGLHGLNEPRRKPDSNTIVLPGMVTSASFKFYATNCLQWGRIQSLLKLQFSLLICEELTAVNESVAHSVL